MLTTDTDQRRRGWYQWGLILLQGLLGVTIGSYAAHSSFIELTWHPTILVGRSHIAVNYQDHPGKYLFSAILTGVGGVAVAIWGAWTLWRNLPRRPW
jgi:hypothetical protein